jgi:ABC-type bacteriocin/lantibiotic exporter with double-glycine peptidase domain
MRIVRILVIRAVNYQLSSTRLRLIQFLSLLTWFFYNFMVCSKCEKNLSSIITLDARGTKTKERKINENKLLKKRNQFEPYSNCCKLCKTRLHQKNSNYCQKCAFDKGICAMCGVKMIDVSMYKNSTK